MIKNYWNKFEDIKKMSEIENMIYQLENKEKSFAGENGLLFQVVKSKEFP